MRLILIPLVCLLLAACAPQKSEQSDGQKSMMQMANGFKQSGHLNEAATIYAKVAEDEENIDAYIELARILRKMGRGTEAVNVMQKAYDIDDHEPRILKELGYSLIGAGKGAEAQKVFEEWAKLEPQNFAPINGLGVALDTMGDHANAQATYKKALLMQPTDAPKVQNNLAMSLILSSKWDEAIALLEPLAATGGSPTIRQNLALAYGLRGDKKKALALNLKDLPAKKAQENMKFYEEYKKRLKKGGKVTPPKPPSSVD
ncbi:MAG: hypothetical protein EBR02_00040 [Alphaproteobacteria bacterium]|nr:hypothetical protein [Alphaproteobacteria bacterium]